MQEKKQKQKKRVVVVPFGVEIEPTRVVSFRFKMPPLKGPHLTACGIT